MAKLDKEEIPKENIIENKSKSLKEKYAQENILMNKYQDDTKEIFFKTEKDIDSDSENFCDFIYKGKELKI